MIYSICRKCGRCIRPDESCIGLNTVFISKEDSKGNREMNDYDKECSFVICHDCSDKIISSLDFGMSNNSEKRINEILDRIENKLSNEAEWIHEPEYEGSSKYKCSNCGRRAGLTQTRRYKHCPKCGFKMKENKNNV